MSELKTFKCGCFGGPFQFCRTHALALKLAEFVKIVAATTPGHSCVPLEGYGNKGGHIDGLKDQARALLAKLEEGNHVGE